MRIDGQVVGDVVAVVCIGFENRRQPDGRATQVRDVIEVARNPRNRAAVEAVRSREALGSSGLDDSLARFAVVETVHHQKVNKLLPPLPVAVKVTLAGKRRKVNLLYRGDRGHFRSSSARDSRFLVLCFWN